MASETPYLRAILPSLPSELAKKVRTLCGATTDSTASAEYILDTVIRFVAGAECGPTSTAETLTQWPERQTAAKKVLDELRGRPSPTPAKRSREDDVENESQPSKRQRPAVEVPTPSSSSSFEDDKPMFTIHSISVTSPVRKKVDITVHKKSMKFTNPTTHAVEASVPYSTLTRAFVLPTRGKQKAHWTVVILSSDIPDRGKPASDSANLQVIFGMEAIVSAPFSTTTHIGTAPVVVFPKGSTTLPAISVFLARLNIPIYQPTGDLFKSACTGVSSGVSASQNGVPGVDAYRGARPGTLWFMKEGLLWGESKPCEFWAVEDLIGKSEGLRVVGNNVRTCSVILTRKSSDEGDDGQDSEDVGIETQFGVIDTKEQPGIDAWVRAHRHLFGKKRFEENGDVEEAKKDEEKGKPDGGKDKGKEKGKEKMTIKQIEDDSDDEDEDFEVDSEDGMDCSSSSESSDEGEGGDSEGSQNAEDEAEVSQDGGGSDEEEELKEENHPLMRPGAMPRMTRAVIDMVVGMVEDDMMGTSAGHHSEMDDDDLEEDELDD
ncbi:hypothetical protein Hypma_001026 [Hypsizygus marmoreus]|uniref:Histone chaperone RTT106/FACT complex subunit SPT16-like middle domain-containing protein n=1 Tax=Hypsizygus marmoreus TaxID=39966 RepID=A0A369J690_HYPMA|nr:hypothetical protein Hypma_001026 [Hypsizygus marmoreus]